jgi:serine/threonine-protein kinase
MGRGGVTESDRIGAMIAGKYRIKRRVGAGGMGAVYEGENVAIRKRVAIKVIEHQHAHAPELAKRFQREAEAASAVESEHIVQVFDIGQDPTLGLYMVMEMLAGEDLSARIEKAGGKLPVEDASAIMLQTARGLAKAHAAGVVHRDLKPANLFLTAREDGTVRPNTCRPSRRRE